MIPSNVPAWVKRGAIVHLDFKNGRYYGPGFGTIYRDTGNSTRQRMNSVFTGAVAGGGGAANTYYAPDSQGIYRTTEAVGLRITDLGVWNENSAVNYLLQSRNLTNAVWTASNVTVSNTNIPGCDGKTSGASRLTATANNGTISQNNLAFGMTGGDGITINTPGTSYVAGNSLTLAGGTFTTAMRIGVKTVSSGGVTTPLNAFPDNVGLYTVRPTFPASVTGGAGTGATFTVNDTYIFSFLIKRVTGTGVISMTLDGTNYTDITSQINSSTYSLVFVTSANPSTISPGFKFATSGDAIDVDMGQLEPCLQGVHQPTTRIVTTTVPVPRGSIAGGASSGEGIFFNAPSVPDGYNAGWKLIKDVFQQHEVSCLVIGSGNGAPACLIVGTDLNFYLSGVYDGSVATLNNGSTGQLVFSSSNTGNAGLGNRNKIAFALGADGAEIYLNGVRTSSSTCKLTIDHSTHGGIGNRGAGDVPMNGPCEEFVVWPRKITAGEGIEHTR